MGAMFGAVFGMLIFMLVLWVAIATFVILVNWKLFKKMGYEGWKSLIPIYNMYLLFEKTLGNGAKMFLMLVPFFNIYIMFLYCKGLAEGFGKDSMYTWLLFFLSPIGLAILAFGKDEWIGLQNEIPEPMYVQQPKQVKKQVRQPVPQPEPMYEDDEMDYDVEEYEDEEPEMDEATKKKLDKLNQLYREGRITETQYNAKLQQLAGSIYK